MEEGKVWRKARYGGRQGVDEGKVGGRQGGRKTRWEEDKVCRPGIAGAWQRDV